MLLCDLSACDSRLANVRSVVSRSSNKPFSERDFTASERAGAGTCCMLEHFHFSSWLLMMESKSFQLRYKQCQNRYSMFWVFLHRQTD